MSRSMPSALRAALVAAQTVESVLTFLTITHDSSLVSSPIRIVNNTVAVTRGGNSYSPYAFAITLPSDKDDAIGDAVLVVDAVDLVLVQAVRSMATRATVNIVVALASAPDSTPELSFGTFEWRDITYTKTTISGTLAYSDKLDIMIPSLSFTPNNVPGNF